MNFGEILRIERTKINLTQEDLGKLIGKSKNNISQYETGKREPDLQTLNCFAEIFDCSIDYLLGKSVERTVNKNTYIGEELKDKIPKEFKELFGEDGLKYIKFAKKMKEEDVTPEMLEDLLETLKKYKDQIK